MSSLILPAHIAAQRRPLEINLGSFEGKVLIQTTHPVQEIPLTPQQALQIAETLQRIAFDLLKKGESTEQ